jgi:hypothetical protein
VDGVNDTAGQGTSKFSVLWLLLKEIPIKKSYIGKLYYIISTTFPQKYRGYLRITFVVSGVNDTKKVDFIVKYLRKNEAICKKALTGAQMELFDEKNQR